MGFLKDKKSSAVRSEENNGSTNTTVRDSRGVETKFTDLNADCLMKILDYSFTNDVINVAEAFSQVNKIIFVRAEMIHYITKFSLRWHTSKVALIPFL